MLDIHNSSILSDKVYLCVRKKEKILSPSQKKILDARLSIIYLLKIIVDVKLFEIINVI